MLVIQLFSPTLHMWTKMGPTNAKWNSLRKKSHVCKVGQSWKKKIGQQTFFKKLAFVHTKLINNYGK